jgi:hypothetical protein
MKWRIRSHDDSERKKAQAFELQQIGSFAESLKILEEIGKDLDYFDLRIKYLCLEGLMQFNSAFVTINEMIGRFSNIYREDYEAYLRLSTRLYPSSHYITNNPVASKLETDFDGRLVVPMSQILETKMLRSKRSLGKSTLYKCAPVYMGASKANLPVSIIESRESYLLHFDQVSIFSESSWVLNANHAFHDYVSDDLLGKFVSAEKDKPCVAKFVSNEALFDFSSYSENVFGAGIWLGGWGSTEFGHFFQSIAPKLAMLDSIVDLKNIPLIIDASMPENHKQLVSQLTNRKVELLPPMTKANVENLIYITDRVFCPVHVNSIELVDSVCPIDPSSMLSIKRKLKISDNLGNERIYLTRRSSKWRKLQNEEELERALISHGFKVVDLFKMTQSEIRNTFENASLIVSPLSSGILNIIFSGSKTKLIVILGNIFNEEYLAGAMNKIGIDLEFYKATPLSVSNHRHSDTTINVTDFTQEVIKILKKQAVT